MNDKLKGLNDRLRPETDRPVFRKTSDALNFAADQLARMESDQSIVALLGSALRDTASGGRLLAEAPEAVKSALVEPELQLRVLREASRIIRELAIEHRVLELDATRRGAGK